MTHVDQVVLTRFNLPTLGVEGLIRARERWLHDRVELFERYCAPSMAYQSAPVSWIVYFDPASPEWLMERLRPLVERGLFRPILRASVSERELLADIRDSVPQRADHLITTNLDNDDGLATDFAERIQSVATDHPRIVIYQTMGLIKGVDGLFLRTDRRNAFVSVRTPWDEVVTAWSEYHNEFPRIMPTVQLGGQPAWLQVVHGANVSNRIRGRLVSPCSYRARFGDLLNDVSVPSSSAVLRDLVLGLPARAARDSARAAGRVAGLQLLGKDRYQEAKRRITELRQRRGTKVTTARW